MRYRALLVTSIAAVFAITGCSEGSVSSPTSTVEAVPASDGGGSSASDGGGAKDDAEEGSEEPAIVDPGEASGSPAPTVEAQEPGSPLVVDGVELAPPEGWQVSGVSEDSESEVVSATSEDGQFIALRSVRSEDTVEEQIAYALDADSENAEEAEDIEVGGETLRGVETALTASGGELVQIQYFARRGDSLVTIDIVTTADQKDALIEHLRAELSWD